MKQKQDIENIELSFVCSQNWDNMTICGNGRFCSVCQKTVYDFTDKSQKEYQDIVQKHDGQICGRVRKAQMTPSVNWAKIAALAALSLAGTNMGCSKNEITPLMQHESAKEDVSFFGMIVLPQPEFIGGQKAMFEFLGKNLEYPNKCGSYSGTVYIGFEVAANGDLSNIVVRRGFHPDFEAEAVRVVKLMSKGMWKGVTEGGKPVKVGYTIPIKFSLE